MTASPQHLFEINRGSDFRLALTLVDQLGAAIDLTGREIAIIDASRTIRSRIAAEISDAGAGQAEVFIEGTSPLPVGTYTFRVQLLLDGGDSQSWPMIGVRVR